MAEIRVKITAEFEKKAMQAFQSEIGKTMEKATGNVGIGAGGIAKIAGVGALAGGGAMAAVDMLVKQFKPLTSMIEQISKTLLEFLRPIAEVIQYLLQPILLMIRPLLQILNAIMAPYRRAAQQLGAESRQAMNEGDIGKGLALAGAAAATILKPFNDFFLQLIAEGMKMGIDLISGTVQTIVTFITEIVAMVAGIFSDSAAEKIRDIGKVTNEYIGANTDIMKVGIQSAVDSLKNFGSGALQLLVSGLGSEVIIPTISDSTNPESLASLTGNAWKAYVEDVKGIIDGTFDPDTEDGLVASFRSNMNAFGKEGRKAIEDAMDEMKKGFKKTMFVPEGGAFYNKNDPIGSIETAARGGAGRGSLPPLSPRDISPGARETVGRIDGSGG